MAGLDSRVGSMFGKYRIVSLLGKGGMGSVYEAYDTSKDRSVALKVLAEQYSQDQEFLERFQRESRTAAKLQEPHVIPIHDWGEINGEFYIDMRLVLGADLQQLIKRGVLPPPRAVAILVQIASALDAAHHEGLIHRDVKPPNIIVTPADFAYLLDFGIAEAKGDSRLTSADFRLGSIAYMAPERFGAAPTTPAVDVYSLACVLHEALTGETPFPTNTTQQEIAAHLSLPPPRPSAVNPRVPSSFDEVIARGMAKEPDDRYGSAGALGRAAERALQGSATGTGPSVGAQVALPMLSEPGREADPTRAMQRPGQSGPHQYPVEPQYPPEFMEQSWGQPGPQMYPPPGPPGYPPHEPAPWQQTGPPMGMPPPQQGGPGSGGRTTVIVLLAVVILAGMGVGAYFLFRDPKSSSSASGTKTPPTSSRSTSGSSGSTGGSIVTSTTSSVPPKPRVKPPVLTGEDSNGTACSDGTPVPSATDWPSQAGRGTDGTTCIFANNVLNAYTSMGPRDAGLRKVSAPGSVSCAQVSPTKCDPSVPANFIMECQSSDSADWITCVGGNDAKVYLY